MNWGRNKVTATPTGYADPHWRSPQGAAPRADVAEVHSACVGLSDALVIVATALMMIGVVMVASTSISLDRSWFGTAFWGSPFCRHLAFALAGFALMLLTSRVAPRVLASPVWRGRTAVFVFILAMAGLAAALIPGLADPQHGSHRWIRFGPKAMAIRYQPSELTKVAMVWFIASLFTRLGANPRSFRRSFLPAAVAIGVCVLLVGSQDFGTAALLGVVGLAMLLVAGCRPRHILTLGVIGAGAMSVLLLAFPYRLARITTFLDYWSDPQGHGYQAIQSLTSIASGGWFGRGLGAGVQKFGYLPAGQTDFIFSVICEEMGVLGGFLVIGLFGALIWLGLRVSWAAASRFERLFAFGLISIIGLQATMNIAVATVVAPTKGISLPLLSAGGSGLLTVCLAIGLLAAAARNAECRLAKAE